MSTNTVIKLSDHVADKFGHTVEQQVAHRTIELTEALAIVEAQKKALEQALLAKEDIQQRLENELEDARLLHAISSMMTDEDSTAALYEKLVSVATLIMRSDFGSMQRYDASRGDLELIAHYGLNDEALAFWKWVQPGRATTCGKALQINQRVIVSDFEACPFIAGSDDLVAFRKAGVRAAQSTPLLTRNGRLVGMITTHWTRCHEPTERDLRLFDIIARQAADLIERTISAEALRQQAQKLAEADRYKNEFLATLAHELRNPLAPIRTGINVLKVGKSEQSVRVLPMMDRQVSHMVRLIDDLLDVSRISRGMLTLKRARVELGAIVDNAIETSQPLINAAGHQFTVTLPGTPVWLDADFTRITQVISNLLNNAVKYTPHHGKIELIAGVVNNEAVISVTDSGIGIPENMLSKIFELFEQVDRSDDRSQSGLGVGLALAKHLTELHDGRIEVESSGEQGGSKFSLFLPLPDSDAASSEADEAQSSITAMKILIVDDNADAAESLALLLEQFGHTTKVVLESPKALSAAIEFKPSVVLLDIGMPLLSGYDLARQFRTHPATEGLYLTALSGWGTDEDRAKSRHAGMDHHLTKPVLLGDIDEMLVQAAQSLK